MFRREIDNDTQLKEWYDRKYLEMGGCWRTPREDCDYHLGLMEEYANAVRSDDDAVSPTLLDVGCGSGDFLAAAEDRGYQTTGVDFSLEACKASIEKSPDSQVAHMNIIDLVKFYIDKPFDWIVSIGSVEHFVRDDACYYAIKRLGRGGLWYFYVPNELWLHKDQPNERTFTDEGWRRYWEQFGLVVAGSKRNGDNTSFWGEFSA